MTTEVLVNTGFLDTVVAFLQNESVVMIVSAIVGFLFNVWKIQPSAKLKRSMQLIATYAPIIFKAVEELAEAAKRAGEDATKIDKALEYEKRIKQILELFGGIVNESVLAYARSYAASLNLEYEENKKLNASFES